MTRYYLHLREFNGDVVDDEDGAEFPSLAAARADAILAMQDLIGDATKQGAELRTEAIVIADEHGTRLAAVPLLAALPTQLIGLLKRPQQVLPVDRFEEYRRNADECRGKAENTLDPDDKVSWLKLADAWLQMLPSTHSPSGDLAGWPKATDEDSKASH